MLLCMKEAVSLAFLSDVRTIINVSLDILWACLSLSYMCWNYFSMTNFTVSMKMAVGIIIGLVLSTPCLKGLKRSINSIH